MSTASLEQRSHKAREGEGSQILAHPAGSLRHESCSLAGHGKGQPQRRAYAGRGEGRTCCVQVKLGLGVQRQEKLRKLRWPSQHSSRLGTSPITPRALQRHWRGLLIAMLAVAGLSRVPQRLEGAEVSAMHDRLHYLRTYPCMASSPAQAECCSRNHPLNVGGNCIRCDVTFLAFSSCKDVHPPGVTVFAYPSALRPSARFWAERPWLKTSARSCYGDVCSRTCCCSSPPCYYSRLASGAPRSRRLDSRRSAKGARARSCELFGGFGVASHRNRWKPNLSARQRWFLTGAVWGLRPLEKAAGKQVALILHPCFGCEAPLSSLQARTCQAARKLQP